MKGKRGLTNVMVTFFHLEVIFYMLMYYLINYSGTHLRPKSVHLHNQLSIQLIFLVQHTLLNPNFKGIILVLLLIVILDLVTVVQAGKKSKKKKEKSKRKKGDKKVSTQNPSSQRPFSRESP